MYTVDSSFDCKVTSAIIILKSRFPLDSHWELQFSNLKKVQNLRKTTHLSKGWLYGAVSHYHVTPLGMLRIHTGNKVEFNTVDFVENRLLPKPATNRQQSLLSPYMVDFVAGCVNKSATTWIRQLVAVDIVANSVDFVARMLNVLSTSSTVCTGLYGEETVKQIVRVRWASQKSSDVITTLMQNFVKKKCTRV